MFYAASEPGIKEIIEQKVSVFIALGPITKISYDTQHILLRWSSDLVGTFIPNILEFIGFHEILPSSLISDFLVSISCNTLGRSLCKDM
jgi:hypothetical protein